MNGKVESSSTSKGLKDETEPQTVTLDLSDEHVIMKRYKIRVTSKKGGTIETSIPKEVVEREARRHGLTLKQALNSLVAVWRYDSFAGLFLSFEAKGKASKPVVKEKERESP